jgi:hypothetical protein
VSALVLRSIRDTITADSKIPILRQPRHVRFDGNSYANDASAGTTAINDEGAASTDSLAPGDDDDSRIFATSDAFSHIRKYIRALNFQLLQV